MSTLNEPTTPSEVQVNHSTPVTREPSHVENHRRSPITVTVSHLTMTTKDSGLKLLNDINITLGPGLTALMGPSGAGKSCLLNCISGLVPPQYNVEGSVRVNGRTFTSHQLHYGYVHQYDELNGHLTVMETLMYAAQLQLHQLSHEEQTKQVEELLRELGLYYVKDTIIGTALKKGISGGQRKRVSVALALLTQPGLILMDEPTAGLDSVTALNLLETLKNLAAQGRTIFCVIHQPQRAIFELLDRLVLIRSGDLIYDGQAAATVDYLEKLGYLYDQASNPADHIMEVISPQLGETYEQLQKRCMVAPAYKKPVVDVNAGSDAPFPSPVDAPSAWHQVKVLTSRQFWQELRQYKVHLLNFFSTAGCALLIGGVWFKLGNAQTSIAKRLPAIFFCMINQSLFGAMKAILAFPDQRSLMLRERRAKMYRTAPCAFAWMVVDLLFNVPWSFLFGIITYFMLGLRHDAGRFFLFVLFLFLDKNSAASLAQMVTAITRVPTLATMILPCALEISRMFSGFFLPPNLLPDYFKWLDPLSYVKYAYVGAALNELDGLHLNCPVNATGSVVCNPKLPRTGNDKIEELGLDYITVGGCVGALIGFVLMCRFITYLALRYLKW